MPELSVGLSVAIGLVGGAFVPLIAYRLSVPAGEPARASCHACDEKLPPGLAGWLRLPARCRSCGARLGPPVWLTSGSAALACALVAVAVGDAPALPLYVAAAVFGVLLATIDVACKRLPHSLIIPAIAITVVLFAAVAGVTGDWSSLLRALAGALALGGVFLALYFIPGGGLGFGDVKLALLLGLFLGWLGWGAVIFGGMLPWIVNAPVVIGLLITRRIGRKSTVPFGPAMLAGSLLAIVGVAALQAAFVA